MEKGRFKAAQNRRAQMHLLCEAAGSGQSGKPQSKTAVELSAKPVLRIRFLAKAKALRRRVKPAGVPPDMRV
jgi:hypothetical protein